MGRGQRASQGQSASTLLFGPRRGQRQSDRTEETPEARALRRKLRIDARQDPFPLIDSLGRDYCKIVLLEAGPVKQTMSEKSWVLTPAMIGDKPGFEARTEFKHRSGEITTGSAALCWTLEEAVEKMHEDCERSKSVALDRKTDMSHVNFDNAIESLILMVAERELERGTPSSEEG